MDAADKLVSRATAITVGLVAIFAAIISFYHIIHIGYAHGGVGAASALTALTIDGTILASSLTLLYCAWRMITAPWLARVMLWLGVGATLACNVGYGLTYGIVGALFSVWPAVAFVGSVEMILQLGKNKRNQPVKDAEEKRYQDLLNLDDPIPFVAPNIVRAEAGLGTIGGMGFTPNEIKRATAPQFNPDTMLIGGIEDGQKPRPPVKIPYEKQGGSVAPKNAPMPPISTALPKPPPVKTTRKSGKISIANIAKAAHCSQKGAYEIRDIMDKQSVDLDKAILIFREDKHETLHATENSGG
jgi:Protein of unknown function (DUF2637)